MQRKTKYLVAGVSAIAILGAGVTAIAAVKHGNWHGFKGHHGEYSEMRGGKGSEHGERGQMFTARFDANGDGKISQDEINSLQADYFTNADADKNGSLSLEEFSTYWAEEKRQQMVRGFQNLDTDGDAAVTQAEFTAHMENRVAMMDRNGDGFVTSDDFGRGHGKGKGHSKGEGKGKGKGWMQNNNAE